MVAEDAALLEAAGVEILWIPSVDEIYPGGFATNVSIGGVSTGLCGGSRPGHFDGVATIITKLFNQIRPDAAFFGQKDFQQLAVIQRLARDLDFTTDIVGVPTVRDADGLALSSRNARLTPQERKDAVALPDIMREVAQNIPDGGDVKAIIDNAQAKLLESGFQKVDYFELRSADTLELLDKYTQPARLLAAAHIGSVRLIDNIAIP
jgi:pantoate--beta-alanine ligase